MTQTGALVGTMEYMSPEQALGKNLDQRSDLFTVGLIFYELLTGATPFRADSAIASLLRRTSERAVPVSDHDKTIPAELSNISASALNAMPTSVTRTRASCCVIWTPGKAGGRDFGFSTVGRALGPHGQLAAIRWHHYCSHFGDCRLPVSCHAFCALYKKGCNWASAIFGHTSISKGIRRSKPRLAGAQPRRYVEH